MLGRTIVRVIVVVSFSHSLGGGAAAAAAGKRRIYFFNWCSAAFTIHGLWPNYDSGGYPSYCDDGDVFDADNLEKNTLNAMNCEWLSLTQPNDGFWDHEWNKHGTCSLSVLPSQEDYFSKALELNGQFDVNVRWCLM